MFCFALKIKVRHAFSITGIPNVIATPLTRIPEQDIINGPVPCDVGWRPQRDGTVSVAEEGDNNAAAAAAAAAADNNAPTIDDLSDTFSSVGWRPDNGQAADNLTDSFSSVPDSVSNDSLFTEGKHRSQKNPSV